MLSIVPFFTMDSCPWENPRLPTPWSLEAFCTASGSKTYTRPDAFRRHRVCKHMIITLPGFGGIPKSLTRISVWSYPDFCRHLGRPRCPQSRLSGAPVMLFDLFFQSSCPLWHVVVRPIFYNGFLTLEDPQTANSMLFGSLLRSIWSQNLQRTPRSSQVLCVKAHNYHVTRIWGHSRVPYPDFGLALPGFLWAFWGPSVPEIQHSGAPAMLFGLFLQSSCPLWYVVDRPIFYNGFLPLEEPQTGNSTLFQSLLRSIWSQNVQRTPRSSEALCVEAHNYHVTRICGHSRVPYPDFGVALPGFLWAFWATPMPQNSTLGRTGHAV